MYGNVVLLVRCAAALCGMVCEFPLWNMWHPTPQCLVFVLRQIQDPTHYRKWTWYVLLILLKKKTIQVVFLTFPLRRCSINGQVLVVKDENVCVCLQVAELKGKREIIECCVRRKYLKSWIHRVSSCVIIGLAGVSCCSQIVELAPEWIRNGLSIGGWSIRYLMICWGRALTLCLCTYLLETLGQRVLNHKY